MVEFQETKTEEEEEGEKKEDPPAPSSSDDIEAWKGKPRPSRPFKVKMGEFFQERYPDETTPYSKLIRQKNEDGEIDPRAREVQREYHELENEYRRKRDLWLAANPEEVAKEKQTQEKRKRTMEVKTGTDAAPSAKKNGGDATTNGGGGDHKRVPVTDERRMAELMLKVCDTVSELGEGLAVLAKRMRASGEEE